MRKIGLLNHGRVYFDHMKKSLTSNPAIYFVSFIIASIIGITYIISGSNIFFGKVSLYLTGVHTVGYYERQVLGPGRGFSIHEYSFRSTGGIKYFAQARSNSPQIEIIYDQDNPMKNIANTPNDWLNYLGFLFLPLMLIVLMARTTLLFFRNKKKLNKEDRAPLV